MQLYKIAKSLYRMQVHQVHENLCKGKVHFLKKEKLQKIFI